MIPLTLCQIWFDQVWRDAQTDEPLTFSKRILRPNVCILRVRFSCQKINIYTRPHQSGVKVYVFITAGSYYTYFQDPFPNQLTRTTSTSARHANDGMHPFARTHDSAKVRCALLLAECDQNRCLGRKQSRLKQKRKKKSKSSCCSSTKTCEWVGKLRK